MTAAHIRQLIENPWNGGGGYTLEQVGQMSLDQIFFRLCNADVLKEPVGKRQVPMNSLQAVSEVKVGPDGKIAGRDAEGRPMRGRIAGKSKARQLMEAAEAKRKAEADKKQHRRRRGRK